MSEQEKKLLYKTSIILGKDTSQMTLNNIIEDLIHVIESQTNMKNKEKSNEYINSLLTLTL